MLDLGLHRDCHGIDSFLIYRIILSSRATIYSLYFENSTMVICRGRVNI